MPKLPLKKIRKMQEEFGNCIIVPCSAESELALKEAARENLLSYVPGSGSFEVTAPEKLSEQQGKALDFIRQNVMEKFSSTGVQETLNRAVFELLGYMYVFPGGVSKLADQHGRVLPDCLLLPPGSTALDFAYRLHTDLGNGFIRAIDVRTKKTIGKEHELKSGDVIEIISRK